MSNIPEIVKLHSLISMERTSLATVTGIMISSWEM